MSYKAKIITGVIVAVVVIGGAWFELSMENKTNSPAAYQTNVGTQNPTTTNSNSAGTGVSQTDTSNAGLQADLSSVDSQMNGFASDNTSINQGMSDQPVQQSQF